MTTIISYPNPLLQAFSDQYGLGVAFDAQNVPHYATAPTFGQFTEFFDEAVADPSNFYRLDANGTLTRPTIKVFYEGETGGVFNSVLGNDFVERAGEANKDHLIAIEKRIEDGEPLQTSDFPAEVFGAPHAKEADYRLPDLWNGFGYWVVSAAAASVLRQFDLGEGCLYPVKVFKNDRETPIGDGWCCINFGNKKSALIPEKSIGIRQRAQGRYRVIGIPKDEDIATSSVALSGPDIWLDSKMWTGLFLSDALAKALKKAKADKGFFLSKCRVIAE